MFSLQSLNFECTAAHNGLRWSLPDQVSLGPVSLLASHCIVLLHHYLDRHGHTCRPQGGIGRSEAAQSRSTGYEEQFDAAAVVSRE